MGGASDEEMGTGGGRRIYQNLGKRFVICSLGGLGCYIKTWGSCCVILLPWGIEYVSVI
jgi:hypothetical protein